MHPWTRPHYGAAKAAESHLAGSLARELAPVGIRVNAISPGSIMFPGSAWEGPAADREAFDRWLEHELPFKRLGTDTEVANVACFLLSDRASWVTGVNLPVDGGQSPAEHVDDAADARPLARPLKLGQASALVRISAPDSWTTPVKSASM